MRKPYTPRPYQGPITNFIVNNLRCQIWARMGMGKTAAVLKAIDILEYLGDVSYDEPVLILAPLLVAETTWPDESLKWDFSEHLGIVPIVGAVAQRKAALRKRSLIYTMNYENLPWLVEYLQSLGRPWPFTTVVADEATKLKGFRLRQGTRRAKALARVAFTRIRRFIELSGTPSPNGLKDLWGQTWFIDGGHRLGRTFDAFVKRWFTKSYDGFSIEPLPFAEEQITDAHRDIAMSLDPSKYFPLKKPIQIPVELELPYKARCIYDEMEKTMFAEVEEFGVEAFSAGARTMKCLQIANGAAYVDENATQWREIHSVKLDALERIIEEAGGMPVLVAYHFKSDLARLQKRFPQGRVLDKNPKTQREWNAGKIPVMFAHPARCGHGLNLQDGGNILVYFSLNWNMEEHEQILERVGPMRQLQSGHDRPVYVYYLMIKDTVDYLVKARLETKKSIQDILIEAVHYRGLTASSK